MHIIIVQDNRVVNARVEALRGLNQDVCNAMREDIAFELRFELNVAAAETSNEIFTLAPLGELVEELSWE